MTPRRQRPGVLLVRHGEPDWAQVEGRGLPAPTQDLVPLTENGAARMRALAVELADLSPALVLSSPVTRALQSAHLVCSVFGWPLAVEHDLREWLPDDRYAWRDHATVEAALSHMLDCGGEWPGGQPQNWEPLSQVRRRAAGCLLRHRHRQPLVAVTHDVVVLALTGVDLAVGDRVEVPWSEIKRHAGHVEAAR